MTLTFVEDRLALARRTSSDRLVPRTPPVEVDRYWIVRAWIQLFGGTRTPPR